MSISGSDNPDPRGLWSSPGWLRLWGALMSGLAHDVTGRASALSSLSMVASRGLANSAMVREELVTEAARMGNLARVIDAFPNATPRRSLGISLSDIASRLPDLLRLATDFRDADVDVELSDMLPAVAVDSGPLSAILLLLMAEALDQSGRPACTITGSVSGTLVTLSVGVIDPREGTDTIWLDNEVDDGITALCARWGGEFLPNSESSQYSMTLPTL